MFATAMRIHVSADTAAALQKLDASFRLDLRGEVDMKVGSGNCECESWRNAGEGGDDHILAARDGHPAAHSVNIQ